MKFRTCAIFLFLFLPLLPAASQALPKLSRASEITTGTLPDKLTWFLVNNTSSKGYANFALVQKGRTDKDEARAALSGLPHFPGVKPYEFLARKGVGYSRSGFMTCLPEAVVFHFEDVPIFDSAASDSTLLLVFDLIRAYPAEQALIISGDIASAKFQDRIKTMSLFVTPRQKAPEAAPYLWNPRDSIIVRFSPNPTANLSSVEVSYLLPRTEKKYLQTPLPLVSSMFARELGSIIRGRLRQSFRAAGIPLAGFSSRYLDASASGSDEVFTFRVFTSKERLEDATAEVARVLAHIDEQGVALDEFIDNRDRLAAEATRDAGNKIVSNGEYVRKCVSSYLYGSHLAPAASVNEFFARRVLTPERELGMFNRFSSALLSPSENLTLKFSIPADTLERAPYLERFKSAWSYARLDTLDKVAYRVNYGDTLTLATPGDKVRAWRTVKEPITGGEMWTFNNGIKVIFKKTSLKNEFRYGFLIKGGYSGVSGLLPGECAFVGDMLKLYDVAGMKGVNFRNMLRANGITMREEVSLSDLRITGSAPRSRLTLLLKSVLSLANDRTLNRQSFEYYRQGEALRLEALKFTAPGINAVMDSIICPDYIYPEYKYAESLRDDLPERADVYFNRQFRNFSDGVIVFVGDLDPYELKKALGMYLGGFKTGRFRATRPAVDFRMRSGWSTYTVDSANSRMGDGEPCVNVAMSAGIPFSMDRYMSFKVALVAFENQIVRHLSSMGMYAKVTEKVDILPVEKMSLYINCWQCSDEGLPADIIPADPLTALGAVRAALSKVSSSKITAAELKAYKAELLNKISSELSDSGKLADMAMMRYSLGKDMVTDYKNHINSVSEASVKEILSALEMGSKVEYIIK